MTAEEQTMFDRVLSERDHFRRLLDERDSVEQRSEASDRALRLLAVDARSFARFTPRKNPSGAYARALAELVNAARMFSVKSDEEWAAEVAELRGLEKK